MTIRVSADLFSLAYFAVSKEETRYYLNGVHIEPHPVKGALLVSTDGHRMVCIHDANAECDEVAIVQLPTFVRALCKTSKKGKGLEVDRAVLEVSKADNRATVVIESVNAKGDVTRTAPVVTAHKVIIEGNFPDWRRVTPKGPFSAGSPAAFNSKLVGEIGQFGARLRHDSSNPPPMYFLRSGDSDAAPVVVRWASQHHIFAILMPMRGDVEAKLPSFLDDRPVEAVAA